MRACVCVCVHIERDRERQRKKSRTDGCFYQRVLIFSGMYSFIHVPVSCSYLLCSICIYIYIYIYIRRERERGGEKIKN